MKHIMDLKDTIKPLLRTTILLFATLTCQSWMAISFVPISLNILKTATTFLEQTKINRNQNIDLI